MAHIKRLVLDVLKPHHPNVVAFARMIADLDPSYHVDITVQTVDEKTESVVIDLTGRGLDPEAVSATIESLGGSVHSVDQVEAEGAADKPTGPDNI
jgi:hypothetical protein